MKLFALVAAAAALASTPAAARCFDVTGRVLVERSSVDNHGFQKTSYQPATEASPGDHLVFQLDYVNARPTPANMIVLTNPIPPQLVYAGSSTPGEIVSVDGGQSFGNLAELTVTEDNGVTRKAMPSDVTHVRWVIHREMPSGTGGQLSFRAVMRDVAAAPEREIQMAMR